MLEEAVEGIETEAVDAPLQPAPDHVPLVVLHARRAPVELGLLLQEGMEVELLARGIPFPARAAEPRDPVVGWQPVSVGADARGVAPQVPVAVGTARIVARRDEPAVGVAGVVHDEVEDDPHAAPMRLRDEPVEIGLAPEQRIDARMVGDVVAEVPAGRWIDRREPDGVDPEAVGAEMVEVGDDPGQVADPVAVGVREAPRVDLVDDATPPPVVAEAWRLYDRCNAGGSHRRSPECGTESTMAGPARWLRGGLDNASSTRH